MAAFLKSLAGRNQVLYYSGLISLCFSLLCIILMLVDNKQVLGINAWIKPFKFFLSICIFNWTMAFYLSLLQGYPKSIRVYSWMVVTVFLIEMTIIAGQAARGQLSHFNISTPLNDLLFALMGIAIMTLTVWTGITSIWFFKTRVPQGYPAGFWWGIRLGIILFSLFSFEGMVMATRLQHTVGAPDGGGGLPVVNWSTEFGDLRIAHFVGIHALQVLPLLGYFLLKKPAQIIAGSILYGSFALWLFMRALEGKGF